MGSGKRHICCCDSTTWCDFIKWTYIIFGIVFLMSAILILYRKDEIIANPLSSFTSLSYFTSLSSLWASAGGTGGISRALETAGSAGRQWSNSYNGGSGSGSGYQYTQRTTTDKDAALKNEKFKQIIYAAVKSGISGVFCVAMGGLVWWGTNSKKSIFLLCYIIVQLVLCACSLVSLLGGVIVLDNRSGLYELTALPATLMALLFVWIVDIQRKEISRDIQPTGPTYQQQLEQARQQLQQPLERVSSDVASSPDDSAHDAPVPSNPNKEP